MLIHVINNGTLIVLGYYGLDQAGENLSWRTDVLLLGGATCLLLAGIAAVRASQRRAGELA
jgi:arginine exporter protein ArgO